MNYKLKVILVILAVLIFTCSLYADDPKAGEEINWQVISNGGTDGTSANYGLKGTVSQTATSNGSSASYGLNHGFWQTFGGGSIPCQGKCGDANADNKVNVSDAVYVINFVFSSGPVPLPVRACGDANSDGKVNVSDAVFVINFVFSGGSTPGDCSPGDPNWTTGDCCAFTR